MLFTKSAEMSLSDATKPLLVVSRLAGINSKLNWHKIYPILILAYDTVVMTQIWEYHTKRDFENYYFQIFVRALQDGCCIASILVILGSSLFDRTRFVVPIKEFAKIDEGLKSLGGFVDNRAIYRWEIFRVICVILVPISYWVTEFILRISLITDKQMYRILLMGWSYYMTVLIECTIADCSFSATLSLIRQRFKEINSIISRIGTHALHLRINFLEVSRAHTENDILRELKVLRSQYHYLWKIANRVNDAYDLHLLVGMTSSFVLLTGKLYELYERFVLSDGNNVYAPAGSINWVLFFIIRIFALAHACESTVAEAKATSVALQDLRMEGIHSPATKDEIREFFTQLQFEAKNFSAYKIFDVNFSLVCGILGATCTYLVIIIQTGHPSHCVMSVNSNGSLNFNIEVNS